MSVSRKIYVTKILLFFSHGNPTNIQPSSIESRFPQPVPSSYGTSSRDWSQRQERSLQQQQQHQQAWQSQGNTQQFRAHYDNSQRGFDNRGEWLIFTENIFCQINM